jgi:hypothetical protein
MAIIDQIKAIDADISAKRTEITILEASSAQWLAQSTVSCPRRKRDECEADKAKKRATGNDRQNSANNLKQAVTSLLGQKKVLQGQLASEAEISLTLAQNGQTRESINVRESITARAQAEAITSNSVATASANKDEAQFKTIAMYAGLGIVGLVLGILIYTKLIKK